MKIRGITIVGDKIYMKFMSGSVKEAIYIKGMEEITIDLALGSFIITADELIAFIKARNNKV